MTKTRTLIGFGICALIAITSTWKAQALIHGGELDIAGEMRFVMTSNDMTPSVERVDPGDELEKPGSQPQDSSSVQGSLALLGLAGIALMRGSK